MKGLYKKFFLIINTTVVAKNVIIIDDISEIVTLPIISEKRSSYTLIKDVSKNMPEINQYKRIITGNKKPNTVGSNANGKITHFQYPKSKIFKFTEVELEKYLELVLDLDSINRIMKQNTITKEHNSSTP